MDAVITFNYDVALDREMKRTGKWSVGDGYGFKIDAESFGVSPCKIYKLHGSTNWRGELFQGVHGFLQGNWDDRSLGERPIIDDTELDYLGYKNASDPRCHGGRARIESLIMPTAKKKFFVETSLGKEWEPFWDSLWLQAGRALARSETIYLIGYSVPEYDTRARDLIAKKIGNSVGIRVCCGAGTVDVLGVLKGLGLLQAERACAETFEEFVQRAGDE